MVHAAWNFTNFGMECTAKRNVHFLDAATDTKYSFSLFDTQAFVNSSAT